MKSGWRQHLRTTQRWRSITLSPYLYAAVGLLILLGTVQVSQAIDFWTTSGRVTGTGEAVVLTGNDPLEIKGWMTLEQVSTTFGIPVSEILSAFDLPADTPASTPLKELESDTFDMTILREWLQEQSQ